MSLLDIKHAKEALTWRLKEWGVEGNRVELAGSFIDDLVEKGWRMDSNRELRPIAPKPHEACRDCGNHVDRCVCPDGPTTRPQPAADGTKQANQIRTQLGWRREVEL